MTLNFRIVILQGSTHWHYSEILYPPPEPCPYPLPSPTSVTSQPAQYRPTAPTDCMWSSGSWLPSCHVNYLFDTHSNRVLPGNTVLSLFVLFVFKFVQFIMLRTKTNVCSTYALEHIQGFHLRDPNIPKT